MSRYTLYAACMLAVGLVGCNEITSPLSDGFDARQSTETTISPSWLEAADAEAVSDVNVPPGTLSHLPDAPALETYHARFTLVQGQASEADLLIRYEKTGHYFMRLELSESVQFVAADGLPVADGDTVVISVDIHPTLFYVQFGPHGTTFAGDKGAILSYNLRYADVEGRDLTGADVWYQPTDNDPWTIEPTRIDVRKKKASIELRHFSNYAVAW